MVGLSVLSHTHTPPADSFTLTWVGKTGWLHSSIISHPHAEIRSLLTHRSGLFSHAESWGSHFLAFTIFLWMNHSLSRLSVCIFHIDFVVLCICPPVQAKSWISSSNFGLCISHCFSVEIGAIAFPMILVVVDSYWVILAMIGTRTTQESNFPFRVVDCLFCCVYAVVSL